MKNLTFTLGSRATAILATSLIGALACAASAGWLLKPAATIRVATKPASWKPATSRLVTEYAAAVTPDRVRPEYPRPQFVRQDWQSLNGLWEFGFDDSNTGEKSGWQSGTPFAEHILVPFSFESALSGIGRGDEVHERVWYRRTFTVPNAWKGKRFLLHFGAVDWETRVWVNGREVGRHQGGYTPFSLDITDAVKSGGDAQELVVRVYDPSETSKDGWQPRGKQRGSNTIWYTRTTGIWQTVWLEPVPDAYLTKLTMTPALDAAQTGSLALSAALPVAAAGMTVEAVLRDGNREVAKQHGIVANGGQVAFQMFVQNAAAWTPETPHLYDLTLRLVSGNRVVDEAASYTAFRTSGIANGRLTLNGKPYFYRGVLDQGYWPDGIYTPPTDVAIKADVEAVKKLGFNMARKHVKVEDPRWYYWCDKLGVAVWQDMPSPQSLTVPEARENYKREWTETIATTRNYPCVVHWIPFNENWGNPAEFQDEIVKLTRTLDPSRPITDASGWTQRGLTDVIDAHNYSEALVEEGTDGKGKPKVVGEYGGVGLTVPGHFWTDGRNYVHANNPQEMIRLIRTRTSQLFDAPNLSGFVYTQLTDVEQELNGLLTYDRRPKADIPTLAAIMSGRDRTKPLAGTPVRNWLVLGPIPTGVPIGAVTGTPDALRQMGTVLDKAYVGTEAQLQPSAGQTATPASGPPLTWKSATGPLLDFQQVFPGGPHVDTAAYAVSYIDSPRAVRDAVLYLGSDDGTVVWLNGKQIHRKVAIRGVKSREDRIPGLSLHPGRNSLVVKVGQGTGGWGLSAYLQTP